MTSHEDHIRAQLAAFPLTQSEIENSKARIQEHLKMDEVEITNCIDTLIDCLIATGKRAEYEEEIQIGFEVLKKMGRRHYFDKGA